MEHLRYPNESAEYRTARNALLDEEIALRRQIEKVAAQRRALPPGGVVPQDYVFERIGAYQRPEPVRLSALFGDKPSILLYSFMFGPERDEPCPGCTHLLDGMEGAARHVGQRFPLYVVAKSPIARLAAWAHARGWEHLTLLSTAGNSYDADYFGDVSKVPEGIHRQNGYQPGAAWDQTIFNAFTKSEDGTIRHFWGSEMVYAPEAAGAEPPRGRSRRSLVGPARHGARGTRGLVPEAELLGREPINGSAE